MEEEKSRQEQAERLINVREALAASETQGQAPLSDDVLQKYGYTFNRETGKLEYDAREKSVPVVPPKYVRPVTDPYGNAWPSVAGPLVGGKAVNGGGEYLRDRNLGSITVDNSQTNGDVYVRLCGESGLYRECFIPAGSQYKMERCAPGTTR